MHVNPDDPTAADPASRVKPASRVDRALDIAFFAPLGLALGFRSIVPELAEAGRKQVEFSRSLGRTALRTIARSAREASAGSASPDRTATSPAASPAPHVDHPDTTEVAGYDSLTAREIIGLIGHASPEERVWMQRRESRRKKRKTVLAALERAATDD